MPIRKVGRRKKKRRRRILPIMILMITVAGLGVWYFLRFNPLGEVLITDNSSKESLSSEIYTPRDYILTAAPDANYTRYASYFNDEQDVQILAAEEMGVEPGTPLSGGSYILLHSTTKYYLHDVAYPYLTPPAADLLNKIGEMYQAELGDTESRLRVTSCLRTPESVKKLKRRNGNAVENSCHLYGTTFDISYSRMEPHEKRALAKALSILRESGYCYVKHERKQPCFHITIRK